MEGIDLGLDVDTDNTKIPKVCFLKKLLISNLTPKRIKSDWQNTYSEVKNN